MKNIYSIAFALICLVLIIVLFVIKNGDNARHQTDTTTITDFSNRLDNAQTQIAFGNGTILAFSNNLAACEASVMTFSNQLNNAQSKLVLRAEQTTNLTLKVLQVEAESRALALKVATLTNQVVGLNQQIITDQGVIAQAGRDYTLLENRLRRDVGERLVMQRKFYNLSELQAQIQRIKADPFYPQVSQESIYAGLDIEVQSNSLHVIAPN